MATDNLIGRTFGKYRIVEQIGRGGMAEVYKAYHSGLDRYVAIKVMHSFLAEDKDFLARFQREAKLVASMRHPNIVQVHDFDVEGGLSYMVMEFIDGETLKARLQKLEAQNLSVSSVGSADRVYAQSLVVVYTGKLASARAVARILGLPESAVITGVDPGGNIDIKVILGTDWK